MFVKYVAVVAAAWVACTSYVASANHSHEQHAQHHTGVMIHDAKVRQFLPVAKSTAAYFSLMNHSEQKRVLTKASISKMGRVEIHEHVHHNGMMRMQQVKEVTVAAHDTLEFQPGGYHLMAFEPTESLQLGEQLTLTLYFANSAPITSKIKVVSLKDELNSKKHNHSQHKHH